MKQTAAMTAVLLGCLLFLAACVKRDFHPSDLDHRDQDPERATGLRALMRVRRLTSDEKEEYWTAVLGPRLQGTAPMPVRTRSSITPQISRIYFGYVKIP